MNSKTLRSLSLGAIALSRQFGVRITVEQLEKKISQGQIKSEKELKNTLKEQGVKVQRLKPSLKTLIDRSYYFANKFMSTSLAYIHLFITLSSYSS